MIATQREVNRLISLRPLTTALDRRQDWHVGCPPQSGMTTHDRAPASAAAPENVSLFSLAELGRLTDPYPAYARLRTEDPIHRTPDGEWILTRHADVAAVLRDPRFGPGEAQCVWSSYVLPQMLLYQWLTAALFLVGFGLVGVLRWSHMARLGCGFALAVVLSLPALLPLFEMFTLSLRTTGFSLEEFLGRTVKPVALVGWLLPFFNGLQSFLPDRASVIGIRERGFCRRCSAACWRW
jgi:hypothetical protein